jgi:sigma-B regulation protein RsbQ
MQTHTIRGADLAVFQSGDGDRDLVLVHGFQSDHSVWNPLIERLDADAYRFTSFDLVGCGASGNAETWQRCTIEEYAADLVALCDTLGIDEPVVIGHSLGGGIALSAALANPGRLAAAVLLAPASTTGLDFLPDEASFNALAYPTGDQKRALAARLFRHPLPDDDFEEIMAVVERASPQHNEGAARSMRDFDIQPHLAGIGCPTILVCGDRDRHMLPRNHLATWAAIPRCGLQVYYDVAHMPFVETPDACAADVERFLAQLR